MGRVLGGEADVGVGVGHVEEEGVEADTGKSSRAWESVRRRVASVIREGSVDEPGLEIAANII